jgi:hypothetical protein
LPLALDEAAAWSGIAPSLVTQCHEQGAAGVVVALAGGEPGWDDAVELGRV